MLLRVLLEPSVLCTLQHHRHTGALAQERGRLYPREARWAEAGVNQRISNKGRHTFPAIKFSAALTTMNVASLKAIIDKTPAQVQHTTFAMPHTKSHTTYSAEAGRLAILIAMHPTSDEHFVNVWRLLSCLPVSDTVVISTSEEHVARVKHAFALWHNVGVISRPNTQYDAGKWCSALESVGKEAHHYRFFVLANDSVYLLHAIPALFTAMQSGKYQLGGLVSTSYGWNMTLGPQKQFYHVASFLRVFTRNSIRAWSNYSCGLPSTHDSFKSKRALVNYHEIGASQLFTRQHHFALDSGDPLPESNNDADLQQLRPWQHNISLWQERWPLGFAAAKRQHVDNVCPRSELGWGTAPTSNDSWHTSTQKLRDCLAAKLVVPGHNTICRVCTSVPGHASPCAAG